MIPLQAKELSRVFSSTQFESTDSSDALAVIPGELHHRIKRRSPRKRTLAIRVTTSRHPLAREHRGQGDRHPMSCEHLLGWMADRPQTLPLPLGEESVCIPLNTGWSCDQCGPVSVGNSKGDTGRSLRSTRASGLPLEMLQPPPGNCWTHLGRWAMQGLGTP